MNLNSQHLDSKLRPMISGRQRTTQVCVLETNLDEWPREVTRLARLVRGARMIGGQDGLYRRVGGCGGTRGKVGEGHGIDVDYQCRRIRAIDGGSKVGVHIVGSISPNQNFCEIVVGSPVARNRCRSGARGRTQGVYYLDTGIGGLVVIQKQRFCTTAVSCIEGI